MNFVDRIEETARLRDALSREKFSLVVVYGRRRLGKSTLIKGACRTVMYIFFPTVPKGNIKEFCLQRW